MPDEIANISLWERISPKFPSKFLFKEIQLTLRRLTRRNSRALSLRHLLAAAFAVFAIDAQAQPRQQTLPPTPAPAAGKRHGTPSDSH